MSNFYTFQENVYRTKRAAEIFCPSVLDNDAKHAVARFLCASEEKTGHLIEARWVVELAQSIVKDPKQSTGPDLLKALRALQRDFEAKGELFLSHDIMDTLHLLDEVVSNSIRLGELRKRSAPGSAFLAS